MSSPARASRKPYARIYFRHLKTGILDRNVYKEIIMNDLNYQNS